MTQPWADSIPDQSGIAVLSEWFLATQQVPLSLSCEAKPFVISLLRELAHQPGDADPDLWYSRDRHRDWREAKGVPIEPFDQLLFDLRWIRRIFLCHKTLPRSFAPQ
jgi:hypothetical protein